MTRMIVSKKQTNADWGHSLTASYRSGSFATVADWGFKLANMACKGVHTTTLTKFCKKTFLD